MENINNKLKVLIGKICWGILSGEPNGSYIHLHFGEKIKRKKTINNKYLEYGLNEYVGEYHLGIFCTWRLQKKNKPITSSSEPNNTNGPLVNGLKELLNKKITLIRFNDPCGDLDVFFDDFCLKIFCSNTGNEDINYYSQNDSNWYLHFHKQNLVEVLKGCLIKLDQ